MTNILTYTSVAPMAERADRSTSRTVVAIVGFVSALIAIFTFATGWVSLRDVIAALRSSPAAGSPASVLDLASPDLVPSLTARTFEVGLGKALNGFSYSTNGDVRYDGRDFRPRVHFTPADTPAILVSQPQNVRFVTILGLDRDGQRSLFVVHVDQFYSIFAKQPARDVYWSPDRKHVVTLNVYEAQWFASIDLASGAVVDGPTLGTKDTLWYVEGDLRWTRSGSAFLAKVVETENEYEGGDINKGPLNTFPIKVDVASLSMQIGASRRRAG
jgi:hypothetical protein